MAITTRKDIRLVGLKDHGIIKFKRIKSETKKEFKKF